MFKQLVMLSAISGLLFGQVDAQTTIHVPPQGTGSWFDLTSGFTLGQTFTPPNSEDHLLQTFTFRWWVEGDRDFLAAIHQWDSENLQEVGDALWSESGLSPTSEGGSNRSFAIEEVLNPLHTYMFSLRSESDAGSYSLAIGEIGTGGGAYSGGEAYTAVPASSPRVWVPYDDSGRYDRSFTATFSRPDMVAVPEPTSYGLLLGAFLLLALYYGRVEEVRSRRVGNR